MESHINVAEKTQVCITCRNRRVRCDRELPICGPCRQACVPCTHTRGFTRRKRGHGLGVSTTTLDDSAINSSSSSLEGSSMLQTARQERDLQFVNISQPLEAGKAENRAKVRSHVMRNFKQRQRIRRKPTSNKVYSGTRLLLGTTRLSRNCNCRSLPPVQVSDAAVPHTESAAAAAAVTHHQTLGLPEGGDTSAKYGAIPQFLTASRLVTGATSTKKDFCGKCGGRCLPGDQKVSEIRDIKNNQLVLRGDVFDPFDTLRSSTSRIEVRELVYHAVNSLWPSLCPVGIFDPMDEVFGPLVISDELLFQANLFNAGFHLSALQGRRYSTEGTRHRFEAIKLLNKRLGDPQNAVTEITISVVVGLLAQAIAARNSLEIKIHANGLQKMVNLVGGLEQLGLDGLLQELVYWTELCSAVVMNTEPLFAHPTTYQRLTILPIFTEPRCPFSKLGHGFRDMFPPRQAQVIQPFQKLLEQLNQVRALGWVSHISNTCGRSYITLRSFFDRGTLVKRRILALPNVFTAEASTEITTYYGSGRQLFESLRFATLIFCEFMLAVQTPADRSTLSALDTFSVHLIKSVQNLDIYKMQATYIGFFFWVFSMGAIASTKEGMQAHFTHLAERAASLVKIQSWQEAKTTLVQFLAIEVILEGPLKILWTKIEKQRADKLIIHQRLGDHKEARTDRLSG